MKNTLLVLGATSDMALASAEIFAKNGYNLILAARNVERLQSFKADKEIRYNVEVEILEFDAHADTIDRKLVEKSNLIICAIGYLGDQEKAMNDWKESEMIIDLNYTSVVRQLNHIATIFSNRKTGTIIGISSVAGERGRGSNFLYGSSKAAFTAYLSGLRNSLHNREVHVMTVKPGFVRTKMTQHLELPEKLTASADRVARGIYKAYSKRKNVVYILPLWRVIMFVIKSIPEGIFKKLNL